MCEIHWGKYGSKFQRHLLCHQTINQVVRGRTWVRSRSCSPSWQASPSPFALHITSTLCFKWFSWFKQTKMRPQSFFWVFITCSNRGDSAPTEALEEIQLSQTITAGKSSPKQQRKMPNFSCYHQVIQLRQLSTVIDEDLNVSVVPYSR